MKDHLSMQVAIGIGKNRDIGISQYSHLLFRKSTKRLNFGHFTKKDIDGLIETLTRLRIHFDDEPENTRS